MITDKAQNIEKIAKQMGAISVVKRNDYNGMQVYEPIFKDGAKVGYPVVIFVKDDKFRLSTPQESIDYLRIRIKEQEALKSAQAKKYDI